MEDSLLGMIIVSLVLFLSYKEIEHLSNIDHNIKSLRHTIETKEVCK